MRRRERLDRTKTAKGQVDPTTAQDHEQRELDGEHGAGETGQRHTEF